MNSDELIAAWWIRGGTRWATLVEEMSREIRFTPDEVQRLAAIAETIQKVLNEQRNGRPAKT